MLFLEHLTVYEVNFIYYKVKATIPFVLQQYRHLKCFIRIKTKKKEKHEYYSMAYHTATSDCIPPVKTSLHRCGIFSFYCIYFINRSLFIAYLRNLSGFPGGAVVRSLSANAGDMGSSPGLGRSHMPRSN